MKIGIWGKCHILVSTGGGARLLCRVSYRQEIPRVTFVVKCMLVLTILTCNRIFQLSSIKLQSVVDGHLLWRFLLFFLNKRMGFYFYFLVNYLFIFGSAGSLFLRVGFL